MRFLVPLFIVWVSTLNGSTGSTNIFLQFPFLFSLIMKHVDFLSLLMDFDKGTPFRLTYLFSVWIYWHNNCIANHCCKNLGLVSKLPHMKQKYLACFLLTIASFFAKLPPARVLSLSRYSMPFASNLDN